MSAIRTLAAWLVLFAALAWLIGLATACGGIAERDEPLRITCAGFQDCPEGWYCASFNMAERCPIVEFSPTVSAHWCNECRPPCETNNDCQAGYDCRPLTNDPAELVCAGWMNVGFERP